MIKKVIGSLNALARGLEIGISIIVLLAVFVQIFALRGLFVQLVVGTESMYAFHIFLNSVLTIVIGLEFFRMLCYSDASTVLEVVMFVLARHMIVNETSALENLLTVVGIGIVVLLDVLLEFWKHKRKEPKSGYEANHPAGSIPEQEDPVFQAEEEPVLPLNPDAE